MHLIEWLFIIIGIFFLLLLSIKMLLRSEERLHAFKKSDRLERQKITKLNEQLDDTLVTLKNQNGFFKKMNTFFVKLNRRLFKK